MSAIDYPVFYDRAVAVQRHAQQRRLLISRIISLVISVGISFAMLAIPMARYENTGQMATIWWLLTVYLLQTWSELLLSPTGLSATSKLAPSS